MLTLPSRSKTTDSVRGLRHGTICSLRLRWPLGGPGCFHSRWLPFLDAMQGRSSTKAACNSPPPQAQDSTRGTYDNPINSPFPHITKRKHCQVEPTQLLTFTRYYFLNETQEEKKSENSTLFSLFKVNVENRIIINIYWTLKVGLRHWARRFICLPSSDSHVPHFTNEEMGSQELKWSTGTHGRASSRPRSPSNCRACAQTDRCLASARKLSTVHPPMTSPVASKDWDDWLFCRKARMQSQKSILAPGRSSLAQS